VESRRVVAFELNAAQGGFLSGLRMLQGGIKISFSRCWVMTMQLCFANGLITCWTSTQSA